MSKIRGRHIGLIPQDPAASLNPLMTVGPARDRAAGRPHGHEGHGPPATGPSSCSGLVGIPEPERRFDAYPHQLSGGMRQRVMIALAIACHPALLLADEPTTALDPTIQAQILELIADLSREMNTATILITHNLGIVAGVCDRVAVMYGGRIVEIAPRDAALRRPAPPVHAGPAAVRAARGRVTAGVFQSIPGQPPDLAGRRPGCSFAARCALVSDRCVRRDARC